MSKDGFLKVRIFEKMCFYMRKVNDFHDLHEVQTKKYAFLKSTYF